MQAAWWLLGGILALGISLGPLNNTCCFVGANGDYPTIQAAVDAARSGSTVVVFSGIYRENVIIDKPLRLMSADHTLFFPLLNDSQPLIQARDDAQPVVEIRAPGVTLQGFIVRGGQTGIRVQNQHHIRLLDNRIMQGSNGIRLDQVTEIWVRNNWISGSTQNGVRVLDSQHVRLLGNTFEDNQAGILLENAQLNLIKNNVIRKHVSSAMTLSQSPRNALVGNRIETQGPGLLLQRSPKTVMRANRLAAGNESFWIEGPTLEDFIQDIGTTNTLGSKPILYLNGLKNRRLKPGLKPGFLALINARDITIPNLDAQDAPVGALLINVKDVAFRQATMDANRIGIWAMHVDGMTITDSTIERSMGDGVHLVDVDNVHIERLAISSSGGNGVYLSQGSNFVLQDSEISSSGASATWLENVAEGLLLNNTLTDNVQYAVRLKETRDVTLQNNTLSTNQTGLYLEKAMENLVENNTIQQNQWGIFLQGAAQNTITQNILTLNDRGSIRGFIENNIIHSNVEESVAEEVEAPDEKAVSNEVE